MAANPIGLNSYWNGPVLYSSTSTAPSNEAGRYLIVERRHVRSHPGIRTKLPTIQLVVRVGGFEGLRNNRCLLNTVLFTLILCCAV